MAVKKKWEIYAREYVVSLFPLFMLDEALATGSVLGAKPVPFTSKIENHALEHCYLAQEWNAAHQAIVEKIKKNPKFLKKLFTKTEKLAKKQIAETKKIARQNLRQLSNRQLSKYYQWYCRSNTEVYRHGLILPLLEFQQTTFLSDELNRFLKTKNATKHFTLLTTPARETGNKQHELCLLKILIEIKKNRAAFGLFQRSDSQALVAALPRRYPAIWRLLCRHTMQFAWIHYVYEGPAADEAYFIDIIKDVIRRRVNPRNALADHQQEKIELKKRQRTTIARLKPGWYDRQIIALARDAVFSKCIRRELQSCSYYYISFLLQEIGRRLNLSLRQVRMMLPAEVSRALRTGHADVKAINERINGVVYVREGKSTRVLVGEAFARFSQSLKKEAAPTSGREANGSTAYPGKVRGIVRLINTPEDMVKMRRGDILVSGATNPNLMPAIRQAAAIVTDEGGLTCHAAIVSREFKIPCVVGTNFITRIVKDGDRVEVDATKGIVKKL